MGKAISFSLTVTCSQKPFFLSLQANQNWTNNTQVFKFILSSSFFFVSFIASNFLCFYFSCLIFIWNSFQELFSWTTKSWCITLIRSFRITKTTRFGRIPGRCTRQKTLPCYLHRRRSHPIRVGSIGIKEETFPEPGRSRVTPSNQVTRTSQNH